MGKGHDMMEMQEFDPFRNALDHPDEIAARMKKDGCRVIGYNCSYLPEEFLIAAGFHPLRLFSKAVTALLAQNHLQAYCCAPVKGVLEDCLSGRLNYLDGAVFPHTCDTLQRLSDIWRMNTSYDFFWNLNLPAKLGSASARVYMKEVLERFKTDLENATGEEISQSSLKDAIVVMNRVRQNLERIYACRSASPNVISGTDLSILVKGAMILDRSTAADLLEIIADQLEEKGSPAFSGKRIMISGPVCTSPAVHHIIEGAGGAVVTDDLCTGRRWFESMTDLSEDPVSAIADRLTNRAICPAKHISVRAREDDLMRKAKQHRVDGIVFLLQKFCDPHAFDVPDLKKRMEKEKIKALVLEVDGPGQDTGQMTTRLETFLEMM